MLRIVVPPREWISNVNLRLDPATSWMKVIPCTDSAVHGNDWVDSNDKNEKGHSVEGSFSRNFSSIYIVRKLWPSEVGSHSWCYRKTCFWKKRPIAGRFWKFRSERIHHLSDPCLVCEFREIWLTGNRQSHAYLWDKKNKFLLTLSLLRGSCLKSASDSGKQCTQSTQNFIQIGSLPVQ